MKARIYLNNEHYLAGITLKDETEPEKGNMALHTCENSPDIIDNRRKAAAFLNCSLNDFVCCGQTHSSHYRRVTSQDKGKGAACTDTAIQDTDALYTNDPGLLLCCFTADCVPVIFYDEITGWAGVVHSGWKGTIQEITCKVLSHMILVEHCRPDGVRVYIGPSISCEKFEVDKDVSLLFQGLGYADEWIGYHEVTGKYHIDNQMIVKKQCELQGVRPDHIMLDRTCTYQSSEGFSYRQDKSCGRHMSFIMKKAGAKKVE